MVIWKFMWRKWVVSEILLPACKQHLVLSEGRWNMERVFSETYA